MSQPLMRQKFTARWFIKDGKWDKTHVNVGNVIAFKYFQ